MNNKILKRILGVGAAAVLALPVAASAFVTHEGFPFNTNNLVPGSSVSGTIHIKNETGSDKTAALQVLPIVYADFAPFADEITYDIGGNFTESGDIGDLISQKTLSSVSNGATGTYTFKLTLKSTAQQVPLMGKSFSFNICVGFVGSESECKMIAISPEQPTGGPGGGGGGGGGQSSLLMIFNEEAQADAPTPGSAQITWNTNKPATSQVAYGPISGVPYTLDLNSPTFGYTFITEKNETKTSNHTMVISSLEPGVYVYRVISTASPATVSPQYTFTILAHHGTNPAAPIVPGTLGAQAGSAGTAPASFGEGEQADGDELAEEDETDLSQTALAMFSGDFPGLLCIGIALILFLMLLGLAALVSRKRQDKSLARDIMILVVGGVLIAIILSLIPYICPLIPLWVIIAVYIIYKLIKKRVKENRPNR